MDGLAPPAKILPGADLTHGALGSLAAWLVDPGREVPPVDLLRAVGLSAHAYAALPPEHPARAACRGDYLVSLARHERIKAELLPLLRAWIEAGIEPLLFKGFYLAEFVYPAPGTRFHGDVDILVPPGQVPSAIRIARRLEWAEEHNSADVGRPYSHGACSLYGPAGAACVDLHRWVLHCRLPWNRVQRRVTEAVWSSSRVRDWEGARIRELTPVDALLVGLVLQRCWGDRWHCKPHDAIDFRTLTERLGVTRAALQARARELGVDQTLALFLARCDPPAGRVDLRPPTAEAVRRWNRAVFRERGLLGRGELALVRLLALPRALVAITRGLPSLVAAHAALRHHGDIGSLLNSLTFSRPKSACSQVRRYWTVHGIRWAARLLPRNLQGDCLLRSLALYRALRREGWPVRFVSGVRREGGQVRGHAWVELGDRVLPELAEPDNRQRYFVNVEYPVPAPSDRVERAVQG